jgi:predicted nucleotidyltransferase
MSLKKPATDDTIGSIVRTIAQAADVEQVILFGSRARGDARPDSDVDLLVVESKPFGRTRSRRREVARLLMALAGFPVAKDILVYDSVEVKERSACINHVVAHALREGKVLYARA